MQAGKTYKKMDPEQVGVLLFNESLVEIPYNKISEIIGRGDDFHKRILTSYMSGFDFAGHEIDDAFSRIIEAFAFRWWDCNPDLWPAYLNKENAETIMNSVMLLNTDLHIANAASRSRRITKKQWVFNILNYLVEVSQKNGWLGGEGKDVRTWSRNLEGILKRTYDRTAKSPLPQREMAKMSSDLSGAESVSPEFLSPTSPQLSNVPRMHRDSSSLSLASTLSTGTMFSISDGKRRGPLNNFGFRRKGDRQDTRHSFGDALSMQPHALSLDSQLNLAAGGPSHSLGRHSTAGALGQQPHDGSWDGSGDAPGAIDSTTPVVRGDILLEGQMIRKHLNEKDDVKAKHRQWAKLDCTLRLDIAAGTLELLMEKLEKDTNGGASGFPPLPPTVTAGADDVSPVPMRRSGTTESTKAWAGPSGERSRISSESTRPGKEHITQSFNLLHSLATPLPPPGYSASRPYVFTLRLSDGQIYLFHGYSAEVVREWVRTINTWAARKSKEPLLGSGGNAEFGWGPLLWEREEQKDRENGVGSAASAGTSSPLILANAGFTLSPLSSVPGPKYAASMRSFASAASAESGRSAATVAGMGAASADAKKELVKHLKRTKVSEWMPPVPLGRVMSVLPEPRQRAVWARQQQLVLADIEEHSGFRDPLDRLYVGHPALRQKAQANWMRKQRWLMREYEKYGTYAQLLIGAPAEAGTEIQSPVEIPAPPIPVAAQKPRRKSIGPSTTYSPGSIAPESPPAGTPVTAGVTSPAASSTSSSSKTRNDSLDMISEAREAATETAMVTETRSRP
ncbi:hypothetical protein HKX48_005911 [Thoreauomyces humboldtii]|nr:hypothetical protein HKX48_005911 [Thoreauomyces humboldtii]